MSADYFELRDNPDFKKGTDLPQFIGCGFVDGEPVIVEATMRLDDNGDAAIDVQFLDQPTQTEKHHG